MVMSDEALETSCIRLFPLGFTSETSLTPCRRIHISAIASSTTLQYVPYVGEYVVDALLAVFPEKAEEVVEVSVREVRAETAQVEKVISAALNAGIDAEVVSQSAIKGGATTDEVMAAITKQSNNKF